MTDHAEFDFETRSSAGYQWTGAKWVALPGVAKKGLSVVGAPAYAEHPSTSVLTLSYRLPLHWIDAAGQLRVGGVVRRWRPGLPNPQDLFDYIAAGHIIEAHNVMFERLIWKYVCTRLYGWPDLEPHQYQLRCSAAKARVNSLPGALGNLSDVLQLTIRKDADGKRLLDKFSVPRNPTKADPRPWITPEEDPADAERLYGYCDTDILSEAEASGKMHPLSDDELRFWLIDQEINMRGIAIDRAAVRDCIAVMEQVFEKYEAECLALTGLRPGQRDALLGWLAAQGVRLPDMRADTLRKVLGAEFAELLDRTGEGDEDEPEAGEVTVTAMPPHARRALELRALTASASVKKLYAMEHRANSDDRLRDLIMHHGARTGRPIGQTPQPLNLPKPGPDLRWCASEACSRPFRPDHASCPWCMAPAPRLVPHPKTGALEDLWKSKWPTRSILSPPSAPEPVDAILEVMSWRSLELVEHFIGDALLAISGCIRGLFVAAPGHELIASDFSSIEAVVLAQLAGERWRVEAFEEDKPIYLLGASKITGTPLEDYLAYKAQHGDHHPDRQKIGKVSELACLGPDTLVWTKLDTFKGPSKARARWRRLADVTADYRVWDGKAWVRHEGLVSRGVRPVALRCGIVATKDHEFLVGRTWRAFEEMTDDEWFRAAERSEYLFCDSVGGRLPTESPNECEVFDLMNAGPRHRFLVASDYGPVLAHNCGYGGWIGSYKAFGSTEPDDVIKAQILGWRAASPSIPEFWGGQFRGLPWDPSRRPELFGLEGHAIAAIQNPGQAYEYRSIGFYMRGSALIVRLPSGRELTYHNPRLVPSTKRQGEVTIVYWTWNSNPKYGARGWGPMETYGGRLCENIVQAVAHDILRYSIERLREAGYPTVLHVYDEIIAEAPAGTANLAEFERIMAIMPPWAVDAETGRPWPIRAAGGWVGRRYRKG